MRSSVNVSGGQRQPTGRWPAWNCAQAPDRCEGRIRNAEDTGLRNLPMHGSAQNQIWCEIVALACELLASMQMLALAGATR
jgi:hypothetical protein